MSATNYQPVTLEDLPSHTMQPAEVITSDKILGPFMHATIRANRAASLLRSARKAAAARRIPHLGLRVRRKDVLGHRYLRDHGLPHSSRMADVLLMP